MMRRKAQLIAGVLLALAGVLYAQATPEETQNRSTSSQSAQRARAWEVEGRLLAVRVCPDPESAPDESVLVHVPIHNLAVTFDAIGKACPDVTESAYVLIQAADQTDERLATFLGRYVRLQMYHDQLDEKLAARLAERGYVHTLSLQTGRREDQYSPNWTFFDALGDPMAGASVEIEMHPPSNDPVPPVRLGAWVLDDAGQTTRFLTPGADLTMTIEHPDYGIARLRLPSSRSNAPGIVVAPMVPRNSAAFPSSLWGTVVDDTGTPIAGIPVSYRPYDGTDPNNVYQRWFDAVAITDTEGRFSLCCPELTERFELGALPEPGARYSVTVEPPKSLNLHQLRIRPAATGVEHTFTLLPIGGTESFHTFSFEYHDGSGPTPAELQAMTLTLERDDRQWLTLSYDEFKNGAYLPTGTLQAQTRRQDKVVRFQDMAITNDSPEHLALTTGNLIVYHGHVINSTTGAPAPGVFVVTNHQLGTKTPSSLSEDDWQQLKTEATDQATSEVALYQSDKRVAVTDADGNFAMTFVAEDPRVHAAMFYALAPGHSGTPREHAMWRSGSNNVVEVPTLVVTPEEISLLPRFVFEDESGPVTDPERLRKIHITIRDGSHSSSCSFDRFLEQQQLRPGLYCPEVTWNDKYYTFEPVDLTVTCPDVVTFRPQKIHPVGMTVRGLVVNGITGAAVPRALVACTRLGRLRDGSSLQPEQWAAIRSLDLKPNPSDPILAPIISLADDGGPILPVGFAITDENGVFEFSLERTSGSLAAYLSVFVEDGMSLCPHLEFASNKRNSTAAPGRIYIDPDADGIVLMPTLKVYPAAKVSVRPVVPESAGSEAGRTRLRLGWTAAPGEFSTWLADVALLADYYALAPDTMRTVYVPARVSIDLAIRPAPKAGLLAVDLGRLQLQQGQWADFGDVALEAAPAAVEETVGASR